MYPKIGWVRREIGREARSGAATLVPTHSPSLRTPLECVGPLSPPRSVPVCPWWSSPGALRRNAETGPKSGGDAQGIPLPRGKHAGLLRITLTECARAFPHFAHVAACPARALVNGGRHFRAPQRRAASALAGLVLGNPPSKH
jgi:hypothetical protein